MFVNGPLDHRSSPSPGGAGSIALQGGIMRLVAYVRVSTEKQVDEGLGLQAQEE